MVLFSIQGKTLKFDDITPEQQKEIFGDLKDNDAVTEVAFSGNTIGPEAAKWLGGVLAEKKNLEVAELSDIFVGRMKDEIPIALKYLLDGLLQCPNLHTVKLSDNAFGPTAQEPLIDFLSRHTPLQHLYLHNNGLGPQTGAKIAGALKNLAANKKKANAKPLRTIICGRNRLENGSMEAWAEAFQSNPHLEVVRMVQNGIRPEGIEHLLIHGLSHCTKLRILDLQDNTFTHRGTSALAVALAKWPGLQELGMNDCLLSAPGGIALMESFAKNSHKELEILRLQYNEIELPAVQQLSELIEERFPKLKLLELNGNRFSEDDDVVDEIRALFSNRGFGELDELDDMEELTDEEEEGESEEESEKEEDEDDELAKAMAKASI